MNICYSSITPSEENPEELRRVSMSQTPQDASLISTDQNTTQDNTNQEDSTLTAMTLVREVLYGSRDNVNFIHEMYRQAFLLDFTHAGAIRKAIGAYKDWIQMNVSLHFLLESLLYIIIFTRLYKFG